MTAACLEGRDDARTRTRIVVIEDDFEMAQAIRHLLIRERYEVELFLDARDALDALRTERVPDLILLDLWTPSMNGWQFRLEQKRDPRLAGVPVIAISADRSPHAAAIDADRFLEKPVTAPALIATTRELLARARSTRPAAALSLDDWNALYVILSDLKDARAHAKLLASDLTGFPAARAVALNVLLERAETCTRSSLGATARGSLLPEPLRESRHASVEFDSVEAFVAWSDAAAPALHPQGDGDVMVQMRSTALLRALAASLRELALWDVRFELVADGEPLIEAEWVPVVQLLRNVLRNAQEALEGVPDPALRVVLSTAASSVQLDIMDAGTGATRRELERAFDPFFTTKSGHAGLGLTVARRIVTRLQGSLTLELAPTGGTVARLSLPRSCEPSTPLGTRSAPLPKLLLIHRAEGALALKSVLTPYFRVHVATAEEAVGAALDGARYDIILCGLMVANRTGINVLSSLAMANPSQAARLVMLVPPDCEGPTETLLSDLRIWHVVESLPAGEFVAFLRGLLQLWRALRFR